MTQKIKILRATTIPDSLDTFCRGMLKELSQKYEVVALSSPGEWLNVVSKREGVRVIAVSMDRHISLWRDLKALFSLVKVFHKEKPTMIHSMTPKAGLLCMLAAWITRVPYRVHTFTGLVFPTSTGIRRLVLMGTDRLTCLCATHIIPEGKGVMNDLVNNRITKKPLKVLGYGNVRGVDMEFYSRRPTVITRMDKMKLKDDSVFTFLFVGRIVRDKGVNELIDSFSRLNKSYPQTRLWLIGVFEDKLDPIDDSSRKEITENAYIKTFGQVIGEDLLAYYVASDCFVLPSYREGFPNTVLEAGAMGLPSIVTDINGSREIVVQGENGLVIPPHDSNSLYDAMLFMMKDKVARDKMASKAREMVASRFEQGFVRKCLYDFYDDLLERYV